MIAATITGPSYGWTPNNNEDSIEVFADLESAIVALIERYHANGRTSMSYTTLSGKHCIALFPDFGEGTMFTCYAVAGALDGKPTEQQVLDALSDVHSEVWTWRLTLTGFGMDLSVKVEANR